LHEVDDEHGMRKGLVVQGDGATRSMIELIKPCSGAAIVKNAARDAPYLLPVPS
jgi:hypothetical protein